MLDVRTPSVVGRWLMYFYPSPEQDNWFKYLFVSIWCCDVAGVDNSWTAFFDDIEVILNYDEFFNKTKTVGRVSDWSASQPFRRNVHNSLFSTFVHTCLQVLFPPKLPSRVQIRVASETRLGDGWMVIITERGNHSFRDLYLPLLLGSWWNCEWWNEDGLGRENHGCYIIRIVGSQAKRELSFFTTFSYVF